MTNDVVIRNISAADAIALKIDLTNAGLIMDKDYTWRYQPVKYELNWSSESQASQVTFVFGDPALASFFRLKWTK
jgi:hypothetical protein